MFTFLCLECHTSITARSDDESALRYIESHLDHLAGGDEPEPAAECDRRELPDHDPKECGTNAPPSTLRDDLLQLGTTHAATRFYANYWDCGCGETGKVYNHDMTSTGPAVAAYTQHLVDLTIPIVRQKILDQAERFGRYDYVNQVYVIARMVCGDGDSDG